MSFVNNSMEDRGSIFSDKGAMLNESMQSFKSKGPFETNEHIIGQDGNNPSNFIVDRPQSPGLSDVRVSVKLEQESDGSSDKSICEIRMSQEMRFHVEQVD